MVYQRNRRIHSGEGFVGSFDGGMIRMIWDHKSILGFSQKNALLGPVYMVSGTRDNPPPRDNFTERLYGVVSCDSCPL